MKTELKAITPQAAIEMLALNKVNRPLSDGNVRILAKEMTSGRWKLNGDTIRITKTNRIIDGQHRLHAVVKSGVTIVSLVIYGLDDDVFDTIDVGKRRSGGDTLGCLGEKNSHRLAALLVMIDKYMTGRAESSVAYSNTEIKQLMEKYPDAKYSVLTNVRGRALMKPSIADCCHYLFSKKDKAAAEWFLDKVVSGTELDEDHPCYVLRERLVANSFSNSKLSKPLTLALAIKAWNAFRSGKKISKLQLNLVDGKMGHFPDVQ